jgi:glycosyltransferase involved in cell wall biosynthesis
MRVAQIMAGQNVGGAELFYSRLVSALATDTEVSQVAILRPHERWLASLQEAGVEAHTLRFGGRLDLRTKSSLGRILESFDADVALNWMSRAARFCPTGGWVNAARLGGYYPLKYYKNCQAFIGNTQGICDYLRKQGVPAERVHYISNFIDEASLPGDQAMRAISAVSCTEDILLAAGRLHRNKGFDVLIEALGQLPTATLWLAGDGPERNNLALLAQRLGVEDRVEFLGWQDDLRPYLGRADVFVCSSRIEPLGNVILEAWLRGCPLVAARAAGPVELVRDGVNGSLCELEDASGLAKAVQQLIDSPSKRQDYAEEGRQAYAAGFSRGHIVSQYLEFFSAIRA